MGVPRVGVPTAAGIVISGPGCSHTGSFNRRVRGAIHRIVNGTLVFLRTGKSPAESLLPDGLKTQAEACLDQPGPRKARAREQVCFLIMPVEHHILFMFQYPENQAKADW